MMSQSTEEFGNIEKREEDFGQTLAVYVLMDHI